MALDPSALLERLEALKLADVDERIHTATETLYQALIEVECTAAIGAGPHQRTAQRNGYRPRTLSTTAGDLGLRTPKLCAGSFLPFLLKRRRRIDQALFAVVMKAYLHGVSTRKVGDLVRALGADSGISTSEVSRICADLDAEVAAFRDRSLAETTFPTCSWTPPTELFSTDWSFGAGQDERCFGDGADPLRAQSDAAQRLPAGLEQRDPAFAFGA